MSDSSKYFCSCGKTTLLDGSQSCLCNEIERLRDRVKTLESMGTSESKRLSDLLVEERKRIEELENRLRSLTVDNPYCVIPKTKIDAAWSLSYYQYADGYDVLKELGIVQCPDIPNGCGGSGTVEEECIIGEHFVTHEMAIDAGMPEAEGSHYSYEYGTEAAPCPDCDGHGWVIGDEDE